MPRRKLTRATKTRKTSRVSDGNEVEITNKAEREKLETYLRDFDARGEDITGLKIYYIVLAKCELKIPVCILIKVIPIIS